ncbi:MAG: 5-oxoprolinase subunit PxpB [Polaribacter sp.]|nr:5-oxoprolinase subunit PxpB [Polaribacter sp.]
MSYKLTYKPFGEQAILIEWPSKIDPAISKDIIAFQYAIQCLPNTNIIDSIVGYSSLTLKYNDDSRDVDQEIALLKSIYAKPILKQGTVNFSWRIPVCYEKEFGLDLKEMSETTSLPINEIIRLHTASTYTVYFIGFLPGFLYLGGLNKKLCIERKSTPRLQVAKGAVGIGGSQTGIYPNTSAGGWNIIGKTPILFFDIEKETPCFAKPGDEIQFVPISAAEYKVLEKQVLANTYVINKTAIR